MAAVKREKTSYPGVFYRVAERKGKSGEERIYYIVFKQDGKVVEEKVGRQFADNMTPAKASGIRAERIEGKRESRREQRERLQAEQDAERNKCTIAKLWGLYQESAPNRKCRRTDEYTYTLHLLKPFAEKLPDEITTLELDQLRNSLLKAGRAPQTAKNILELLRRIINFGVKKGWCQAPDASKQRFEMPKVDNQKTETLTAQQLGRYFEALDAEPDQNAANFLRLALATGMRRGAIMALQWDDLDFEKGFIILRGEAAKKGKTERIPMSRATREILLNTERTDSPYVFPGKNGGQRKDFKKIAIRVRDKAGLPADFRPLHGLRHAFASYLASTGKVDLYTLQKLLTHNSPQMTQRYAHLADEALQRAANVADGIFETTSKDKE